MPTSDELRKLSLHKLAESGLGPDDVGKLGIEFILREECPADLPMSLAGFKIPYFSVCGEQLDFYRYRYMEKPGGFSALTKPPKYGQAAGTKSRLYLPPYLDWPTLARDTSKPIIVTEGELKAACLAKHNIPTIGIGGVWCFKSKEDGYLDDFNLIDWEGRVVTIIYDSDAATNVNIVRAENALARVLLSLKARPRVVRLPSISDTSKTGVDDFLLARGQAELAKLVASALEWQVSRALHELNEEVLYVRDPGLVVELNTLQRLSVKNFRDHAYAPRVYRRPIVRPNGNIEYKEERAADAWIKWTGRAEAQKLVYEPGKPRTIGRTLNLWAGWGVEPREGPVDLWVKLLDYIFKDEVGGRRWFEQWLAYPLQHPGSKLNQAVVIWGVYEGTGKSLVGYHMSRIYGSNAIEIGERQLQSSFNGILENKSFVMASEMKGSESKKDFADLLKSAITAKEIIINPKYIPEYRVPDRTNWYFTSNHPNSLHVASHDRRYFIHELVGPPLADDFYTAYDKWYLSEDGAAALFHYLLHLDLSGFNPRAAACVTRAKEDMILNSLSDVGQWVRQLIETPASILKMHDYSLKGDLFTTHELLQLYDPDRRKRITPNGLARELKLAGIQLVHEGKLLATEAGRQRYWVVRNADKHIGACLSDLLKHIEESRGGNGRTKF